MRKVVERAFAVGGGRDALLFEARGRLAIGVLLGDVIIEILGFLARGFADDLRLNVNVGVAAVLGRVVFYRAHDAGRGGEIGANRYGVSLEVIKHLSSRSIDTFRPLSMEWHRFLGLESSRQTSVAGQKRSARKKR